MTFTLTITQDNRAEAIRLEFMTEDKADHAYDTLAATMKEDIKAVEVSDDFGRRVALWGFSSLVLERSEETRKIESGKLWFEAMHMALRHNQNCAQHVPIQTLIAQAQAITDFLSGKESAKSDEPELPLIPEGDQSGIVGLFDGKDTRPPAAVRPWRTDRGLD